MGRWENWSDDEDGIDGCKSLGVGVDAPEYAGEEVPVSNLIRRVQCLGCNDIVELPRRLLRGVRRCRCHRLSIVAMGISGYQYSKLKGFDCSRREV